MKNFSGKRKTHVEQFKIRAFPPSVFFFILILSLFLSLYFFPLFLTRLLIKFRIRYSCNSPSDIMCYEIKRNRSFKIRVQNSFAKSKHPPCISSIFFCYFSRILTKNIDKNISAWMLSNVVSIILFALKFNCKILGTLNRVWIGYLANCGNNPRKTTGNEAYPLSLTDKY